MPNNTVNAFIPITDIINLSQKMHKVKNMAKDTCIYNLFIFMEMILYSKNYFSANSFIAIQAIKPIPISSAFSSISKVGVCTPEIIFLDLFSVPNL